MKAEYKKTGSYVTSIEQQRRIFAYICSYFLSEDSTNILALDNQALFNDLLATQAAIQADLKVRNILVSTYIMYQTPVSTHIMYQTPVCQNKGQIFVFDLSPRKKYRQGFL